MTREHFWLRSFVGCLVLFCSTGVVLADLIEWTDPNDGDFDVAGNWTLTVGIGPPPPNAGDTARFNEMGTYEVTFNADEASDVLNVDAGDITFRSNGTDRTYNIITGTADVNIDGGNLTLGVAGDPLGLNIGDQLNVSGGGTLSVLLGSDVTASQLRLGTGTGVGVGTLLVDGVGSSATGTALSLWGSGSTGDVTFRNGATGNLGIIQLANSASGTSIGIFNVETNATVTTGSLFVATNGGATTSATITVDELGSSLTQNGASLLRIGHATEGTATIDVTNGGTFNTGTGTTTVNATGTINVGVVGGGTFNANGNVNVDGGTIMRGSSSIGFNLATGRTLTATNDAQINFVGRYDIDLGTTFDIQSGADFSTTSSLDIGNSGDGTLVVDGAGSSVAAQGSLTIWGNGNTADVTFRNGATGNLGSTSIILAGRLSGSTGIFNIESGATVTTGPLQIAIIGGATTSGTLTVDGGASSLTLTGGSPLIVGHATDGTATFNVQNSGTFTTGTGSTFVDATGTINIGVVGGGTFNANGNVIVDGGTITRGTSSTGFNLASGLTLTATNDAQINFGGGYDIDLGTTFEIQSGADFSTTSFLDIDGTLVVDGAGSSVTTGTTGSFWGSGGNTADVTLRNGSTGNLGEIRLAPSTTGGTTGIFNVESGATVTTNNLFVATVGGATTSGTITVDGGTSSLTQNGASFLTVGHSSTGTATINVQNGGTLNTGTGLTTIDTTGTLNVNTAGTFNALGNIDLAGTINLVGGTLSAVDLVFTGSTFNFPFGTLELNSNQTLDAARLTELNVATLTAGKTFRVGGTATLLTPLVLAGGTFGADSLVNPFFLDFQTGTFELTGDNLVIGPAGLFGSPLTVASGQTIDITNTATVDAGATLVIESGGTFNAGTLANDGNVILNGPAAALGGTTLSNNSGGIVRGEGTISAAVNNSAGGEIRGEVGKTLLLTAAPGTNSGQINLQGGTLQFSQALTNGSGGNILGRGTLIVGGAGLTNTGDLALSNGQTDVFGDVDNQTTGQVIISGNADVTFWDDVTDSGTVFNVSTGSSVTFFGTAGFSVSGGGEVYMEADVTPGSSPGLETFGGNVHFGVLANLEIEIAGTTLGTQYDALNIAGQTTLDGTLTVSLLSGFMPSAGDMFEIISAASVIGTFATETLPALAGGLEWFVNYSGTSVELISTFAGDFDFDGDVDGFDFLGWQRGESPDPLSQSDLNDWLTNYGTVAPLSAVSTAVPEPSSSALLLTVLACVTFRRRSGSRIRRVRTGHRTGY